MRKPVAAIRSSLSPEMVAGPMASMESLHQRVAELERTASELENRVLAY